MMLNIFTGILQHFMQYETSRKWDCVQSGI